MKRNLHLVIVKRSQKTNDPSPNPSPADCLSQEYSHKLHQLYNPQSDYHLQKNQSQKNLTGKKYQLIWTLLSDLVRTRTPKLNQKLVNLKHRHLPLKREKDSVPMAANFVLKPWAVGTCLQCITGRNMKSCTVTYALKHLTIRLAWCTTNTSTGNTDMCVHVEPPSHSQASYIRTWLCIDGMHHITAFTQTASVHSKTKVI